eukprot:TRINITY_DN24130_c0_g1_i1.p1 TRINITY_DN24130_c0_g1~~TRINITY_DN24130_c0_g1_i1.p1  ORF type:complete len:382 (+),score=136.68 TRINITY_DN24130_c0_g1_i1:520-1665(+)
MICLRICNRLLQRLSSTRDAETRGRVLQLVAYVFSVDERSGLNIKNAFHTENVTKVDRDGLQAFSSAFSSFDEKFYLELWELQDFFSNPVSLSKDLSKQHRFLELLKNVFASFSTKSVLKEAENTSSSEDFFDFPKYLTSPGIFHLQMQDGNFRKQILLQALIIFQFLKSGSKKVPIEIDPSTISTLNTLEDQAKDLLKQCFATNSGAVQELLVHLERENIWMKYKDAGCAAISLEMKPLSSSPEQRPTSVSEKCSFKLKLAQDEHASETPEDALEDDIYSQTAHAEVDDMRAFGSSLKVGSKKSWMTLRAMRKKSLKSFVESTNAAVKLIDDGKVDQDDEEENDDANVGEKAEEDGKQNSEGDSGSVSVGTKRKIDRISS